MNILTVSKTIPFKGMVLDDKSKSIKAVLYELTFTLRTEQSSDVTYDQAYIYQNISFSTISSFIYEQLHQTVMYDLDSKTNAENIFSPYDNNFMILPTINEACLISCIHAKLNAICHDTSIVEMIKLKEMDETLSYEMFSDDLQYDTLPNIKTWLGEFSVWDQPWWNRKDFSTYDNFLPNKEEYDLFFKNSDRDNINEKMAAPIREIEGQIIGELASEYLDEDNPETAEKGKLIEIDFKNPKKFKPKLVPKEPK